MGLKFSYRTFLSRHNYCIICWKFHLCFIWWYLMRSLFNRLWICNLVHLIISTCLLAGFCIHTSDVHVHMYILFIAQNWNVDVLLVDTKTNKFGQPAYDLLVSHSISMSIGHHCRWWGSKSMHFLIERCPFKWKPVIL